MKVRRSTPLPVVLLVLGLMLSGCFDDDKDSGGSKGSKDADDPTVAGFLDLRINTTPDVAGAWFEPGTELSVEAPAPTNAVGNVSYTWALQQDPYSDFFSSATFDTGEVQPGASGAIEFTQAGFFEFGHCDPHPWMKHSVAVVDGLESDPVTVYMLEEDLADPDTYAFSHRHITVGVGTTVTYVNLGKTMHTATIGHEGEAIPPLAALPLQERTGTVALEGSGWMNLLLFAEDDAGNTGWARKNVYVREKFADYNATNEGTFNAPNDPAKTHPHTFEWTGDVTLDVTIEDPTGVLQRINVQIAEKGSEDEPLVDGQGVGSGKLTTNITTTIPREYVLTVSPNQGVATSYSILVSVAYDHTPPPRNDSPLPCPEPHYSLGHC